MQRFFIKKTFLGLAVLFLCLSFILYPGMASPVDAEGGYTNVLPVIAKNELAAETTIFGEHATWKYWDKGSLPGDNWMAPGFNDGAWAAASAVLGYGNGNERTVVSYGSSSSSKYITTYFRKTFALNPAGLSKITMTLLQDDGAVVYLNGQEIFRKNMPDGAVGYSTLAAANGESTTTTSVSPSLFVNGNNTLAVEIHQCSPSSSDIAFSMILTSDTGGTVVVATPTAPPAPTATNPAAVTPPAPTATSVQPSAATPTSVAPTVAPPPPPTTSGKAYYVTTSGSSSSDGSASRPWSLSYALGHPSALRPGDTIWVRGGTYSGSFLVSLKGASGAPITVRAYPGERVILNNSSSYNMDIKSSYYATFWGLEITQNYSKRSTSRSESTYGIRVNQGYSSHHLKFINMIVHDVQSQGIGWWEALKDSEIYGSLFYFNGVTELDHGVYVNSVSGTKWFIDNIVNDNASHGFHGYTGGSHSLDNFYIEGSTFFNNGSVGYNTSKGQYGIYKRNILVGGSVVARNPYINNNYLYYPGSSGTSINLGYTKGASNGKLTNNYIMGGNMVLGGSISGLSMTGNTVYAPGGLSGISKSTYSNNSWLSSKPTGVKFFVRPNKYETTRGNITIFNWNKQSTVQVPAASLAGINLRAGDRYELHNAQNYFGDVVTGVYDGSAINVPMTGRSVAQPTGLSFKPASTFPEFGAFVIVVVK